jgi:hypothetical protein
MYACYDFSENPVINNLNRFLFLRSWDKGMLRWLKKS